MVKRLPAMWETRVQFLGWEDPLEKEMAIHSSTLAWKIPWMEKPDRLQSGVAKSRTGLSNFTFTFCLSAKRSQNFSAYIGNCTVIRWSDVNYWDFLSLFGYPEGSHFFLFKASHGLLQLKVNTNTKYIFSFVNPNLEYIAFPCPGNSYHCKYAVSLFLLPSELRLL